MKDRLSVAAHQIEFACFSSMLGFLDGFCIELS